MQETKEKKTWLMSGVWFVSSSSAQFTTAATSVNSVFIREENDIIHGHPPRGGDFPPDLPIDITYERIFAVIGTADMEYARKCIDIHFG